MNGHTDSRERGCTRQLLAKEGQEEGYWAPRNQALGSQCPLGMEQLLPPGNVSC